GSVLACEPGLQYGSEYVIDPLKGRVFDSIRPEMLARVRNRSEFAGILVMDKWAGNADSRQVVFFRGNIERRYSACFIDHGYCFGVEGWGFSDYPLRGAYSRGEVYRDITEWDAFEPWLSQLENLPPDLIWNAVADTPPGWYLND